MSSRAEPGQLLVEEMPALPDYSPKRALSESIRFVV